MINKSKTIKIKTACGNIYLTGVFQENKLIQVIPRLGKTGTCAKTMLHLFGILFSSILHLEKNKIIYILSSLTGHTPVCGGCINIIVSYIMEHIIKED